MKVTEDRSDRLVIASTSGERLGGVFFIVIPIIILAVYFSGFSRDRPTSFFDILAIVGGLVAIYFGVRWFMGKTIVLEKSTNMVILEVPSLMLARQKRVIPFAEVNSVKISYKQRTWTTQAASPNAWQISLDTGGEMVRIDHRESKQSMLILAHKISGFMGKELIDNSGWRDNPD